jgi:hypothetical protein
MPMPIRRNFHTAASPFVINLTPLEQVTNLLLDWCRLDEAPIYINGVSVQEILVQERKLASYPVGSEMFLDLEQLKAFLKSHLLKNLPTELQNPALEVLINTLHQGNWQRPVSSAAYGCIDTASEGKLGPVDARKNEPGDPAQKRSTHFVTTPNGFTLQENVTQYKCIYSILADNKAGDIVVPDPGKKYIYQAQATIDIDFRQKVNAESRWPDIRLLNNAISFGNKAIEKMIDKRSFGQKVLDVIKNIFGRNKEILLKPEVKPEVSESRPSPRPR